MELESQEPRIPKIEKHLSSKSSFRKKLTIALWKSCGYTSKINKDKIATK